MLEGTSKWTIATSSPTEDNFAEKALTKVPWWDGKCRPDFFVGCNTEHHRWAFYNLQGVTRFHAIHHCDAADMGSPTGQDCIAFQERGIRLLKERHTIKSAHYLSLYYEPKPTWKWQSNTPIAIMSRPWHRRASTVARQELLKANLKSFSIYGEGQPGGFLFETDKRRVMTDCSCYIAMVGETGGFGLSEHEAMAMGCPVVARRWGDMQDRFPGYPGFADSDEDLEGLACRCLQDKFFAESLSRMCLDYVATYHTRERFEESAASLVAFATKA